MFEFVAAHNLGRDSDDGVLLRLITHSGEAIRHVVCGYSIVHCGLTVTKPPDS